MSGGVRRPVPQLVLLDRESPDRDLTARSSFFVDRAVIAVGWGDDEDGDSAAVALDPGDVERLRNWLTAWLDGAS